MAGTSNPVARHALTRKYNPFTRSPTGARILSALTLPHFTLHPPVHCSGYPTRAKIEALHHRWFDTGITLVVELQR